MSSCVHMKRWAIIYVTKYSEVTKAFVKTLFKVSHPMGFIIEDPMMFVLVKKIKPLVIDIILIFYHVQFILCLFSITFLILFILLYVSYMQL